MQHPSRELTDLNLDVLLEILGYLDLKSLVSVAQTCCGLRDAAYTPQLWKHCTINVPTGYSLTELTAKSLCDRKINHFRLLGEPDSQHQHEIQTASLANCFKYVAVESLHLVQEPFLTYHITLPSSINTVTSLDLTFKIDIWRFLFNPDDYKALLQSILTAVPHLKKLRLTVEIASYIVDKSQLDISEHASEEFYRSWSKFDYFALVFRCLPSLIDLELVEFCHIDMLYWSSDYIEPTKVIDPSTQYPYLQRLSTMFPTEVNILPHIPKYFPNLKHLSMLLDYSGTSAIKLVHFNDLVSGFQNLKSLTIEPSLFSEDRDKSVLIPMPTVTAIRLEYGAFYNAYRRLIVSNTQIRVLDLSSSWPSNMDMCAEWNEIPKSAPNLEILILSRNICHPMDRLCENVVQFTPRLFSLIGVLCRENSALPPSLRYITHQSEEHRRACLKRKSGYELKRPFLVMKQGLSWRRVAKDGPCWNEAFGTSYFFPNSDLQYNG